MSPVAPKEEFSVFLWLDHKKLGKDHKNLICYVPITIKNKVRIQPLILVWFTRYCADKKVSCQLMPMPTPMGSAPMGSAQCPLPLGKGHKDFMINLHEMYVAEQGFKLATPGSAVRHATDWA